MASSLTYQGDTPSLRPPHRAVLPLWLALLLKRQRRASIVAPPWLHPSSLRELVVLETRAGAEGANGEGDNNNDDDDDDGDDAAAVARVRFAPPPPPPARADVRGAPGTARRVAGLVAGDPLAGGSAGTAIPLSPPFLPSCTAEAPAGCLPYHWFEVAEILLAHAPDDLPAPVGEVRALLRDLAEARAAKVRQLATVAAAVSTTKAADAALGQGPRGATPAVVSLRGIGAMELAETRGLVVAVQDGVRRLGAAAEASRREEEDALGGAGMGGGAGGAGGAAGQYDDDDDDDEDML